LGLDREVIREEINHRIEAVRLSSTDRYKEELFNYIMFIIDTNSLDNNSYIKETYDKTKVFIPECVILEIEKYKREHEEYDEPFKIVELLQHFQNDAPNSVKEWTNKGHDNEINLVKAYLFNNYKVV